MTDKVYNVLFICTHNPARSILAEGLHHTHFVPRIGPITLVALLFTIDVMFSLVNVAPPFQQRYVAPAPGQLARA